VKLVGFVILVAIILGGLVGTLVVRDPGYVLVSYADTVVETSLWVAAFLLTVLLVSIWAIGYFVRGVTQGQRGVSRFISGRRVRNARSQTVRGLLVMAEGRWAEARKLLLAAATKADTPLINYLNAARASHELGDPVARDENLKLAHETTPAAKFAVTLTQAEFNIDDGEYEQALAALLRLRQRAPKHGAVLAMLVECYQAVGDWEALSDLAADLKKSSALPDDKLAEIEAKVWAARLQQADDVNKIWKRLPKRQKNNLILLGDWANSLRKEERFDEAGQVLRNALDQTWSSELALVYGLVPTTDPGEQLSVAKSWLRQRPNDAALNLTLGRLSLANEQFEQAREYFETSLRLEPVEEVYGELGRLCIAMGDEQRGTEYLLAAQSKQLPTLPMPAQPSLRKASVS
jgi:HemY protein